MTPNVPKTSAKIRIRIMPTNNLGCWGSSSDTSISNDSDSETSSHTRKTDGKTSAKLNEALEERNVLFQVVGDQDGDDKTVNTNDTSHDDGNNVYNELVIHVASPCSHPQIAQLNYRS